MKIFLSRSCLVVMLGIVLLLGILIVPVAADTMSLELGTNRNGNDYTHLNPWIPYSTDTGPFVPYDGTVSGCSYFCLGQAQCKAATYVAADQTCWLKSSVPAATPNSGMTSFVKETGIAVAKCFLIPGTKADFTATPTDGSAPLTVTFTDTSVGASEWAWDFGDDNTYAAQNPPAHTYTNSLAFARSRIAKLTTTDSCGTQYSKTLTINVGPETSTPLPGSLSITSIPGGASAYYDDAPKGTTPLTLPDLTPGIHQIRLSLSGYDDYTTPVTITAGHATPLPVTLTKSSPAPATTGSLQITTMPDGAAVSVDGGSQGITPTPVLILAAGSHTVKLTKAGYTDYQAPVTVTAGKITALTIPLVPGTSPTSTTTTSTTTKTTTTTSTTGTGSISVTSSPSGASVDMDGWQKGTTPVTILQVKAGSHTLTLKKTGYKDIITTVPVTADKTAAVTVTLVPENQQPTGSGTLTVRSTPAGANVYVDGDSIGTTPLKIENVKAGTHKLLLTLKNYKDNSQTVDMSGGSDKEIYVNFVPPTPGFAVPVSLAALALVSLVLLGRKKDR